MGFDENSSRIQCSNEQTGKQVKDIPAPTAGWYYVVKVLLCVIIDDSYSSLSSFRATCGEERDTPAWLSIIASCRHVNSFHKKMI